MNPAQEAIQQREFQQKCSGYLTGSGGMFSQYADGLDSEGQFIRSCRQLVDMFQSATYGHDGNTFDAFDGDARKRRFRL